MTDQGDERSRLLEHLLPLAQAAGREILRIYENPLLAVRRKSDGSPVTEADVRAEAIILAGLAKLTPGWRVISEEAAGKSGSLDSVPADEETPYWLVDPLDGTAEFVQRNGEFTVNIALIEHQRPVLGVVLAPVAGDLYAGVAGRGAFAEDAGSRRPIACRAVPLQGETVVSSRSHGDAAALARWLQGRRVAGQAQAGSSLKFCLLASGQADTYPRFGPTMEWDTAAGHAVLRAAGGEVTDLAGQPLRYGKPGLRNPHFVARGLPPG
ncbi:MAG: 3'(2'),5'-bisphosphate nucleotidase CysQ [Burkholderiales bacterium]